MKKKNLSVAFSLHAKLNFKIIVVGDRNIGKTSLIVRYIKDQFDLNYKVTVGVEFYSKIVQSGLDQVALQIWDTSGSQNHKSIVRSFYNFANCVMILYDNPDNMKNKIDQWIYEVNEHIMEATRLVLVRTKTDATPIAQQEQTCAEQLVEKYGIDIYMGVSSKNGENVEELFTQVATKMKKLYQKDKQFRNLVDHKSNSIMLESLTPEKHKKKKQKCCES